MLKILFLAEGPGGKNWVEYIPLNSKVEKRQREKESLRIKDNKIFEKSQVFWEGPRRECTDSGMIIIERNEDLR